MISDSGLARSQAELAESLIKDGELEEAAQVLVEARRFFEESGLKRDQAESALLMGQARRSSSPAEASEWLQQAIKLFQESEDPAGEIRARSIYSRTLSEPIDQRRELERAEGIASRLRQQIGNPALRARFAASMQFLYDSMVQWYVQQSPTAADLSPAALLASETWRARSLSELVSASKASASKATADLLTERVALQEQLNALVWSTERLARAAGNPAAQELVGENRLQMAELRTRIDEVTAQVFDQAELPDPAAKLKIGQIQERLQDDEAVLYFHLGSPRSVVWWLSSGELKAHYLADKNTINQAAAAALAAVQAVNFGPPQRATMKHLREIILPDPARLAAKRRVYLVLDGELQRVPFSALPGADGGFALNHTSFVQLPAARVLLSERTARRMTSQSSALVFADPVFDPTDPRAQGDASAVAGGPPASHRANLARLAFSSREATGISDVLPNAEMVLGYDASRSAFLERAKNPADILHLATHGIVDVESPTASGLYFSQVDAGRQWTDGFVGLGDIATIPMSFSLAVLSACDTGTGELIDGEGLFSLSRQFLAQGVDQVISTLWQVSDYSSAELMKETYRLMLDEGVPPDLALQQAQKALSQRPGFDAPYFWAGYNLHTTRPLGQSPNLSL
ncbi:MAG: CHAT domain-containing protein [Pseudomonadota bacterium]